MVDAASWESALFDLYGSGWTFARVGPRQHEDWRRDVAAVMALKVTDPRGWKTFNYAPEVNEDRSGIGAPFVLWSPEDLGESLYEIGRESAAQLLVALKGEFFQAAGILDFESRKEGLFKSSEEILSRFDSNSLFFTNAGDARENRDADLLNPDTEWSCLSVYTTDCGVVVVSDTEVAAFWAFWED
ncbi:hypothetical protein [Streptomyces griseofuscus]|uniref:Uncharacterized protein n=1 Tax=Streptomyces griseofuscus TaxID=146922 RepID=A0A7H1Q5Z1_9ACTN|nr:hypothetical protein [Streptomyces griseofuscus]QNT95721.1 hypothetical protein HEP81_05469 [Streptomyces griseofuscus]BBC96348.1 hypothetical protein SRO_5172 [Streptomyces rochei]